MFLGKFRKLFVRRWDTVRGLGIRLFSLLTFGSGFGILSCHEGTLFENDEAHETIKARQRASLAEAPRLSPVSSFGRLPLCQPGNACFKATKFLGANFLIQSDSLNPPRKMKNAT